MFAFARAKLRSSLICALLPFISACGVGYGTVNAKIPRGVYHTVRQGESLKQVSNRFGVSVGELALLNGITSVEHVDVGQVLLVSYGLENSAGRRSGNSGGTGWNSSKPMPYNNYGNYSEGSTGTGGTFGSGWGREPSEVLASSYRGRLSWPLAGGQIVSGFGRRPGTVHDGLDIKAPSGTPIFAAQAGQVVYSDNRIPGYGNLVVLRSKDGFTTVYAHCRRLLVKEGESVHSGQEIAEVGETGHATGPHLHFEVRLRSDDGKYIAVNPLPYFAQMNVSDRDQHRGDTDGSLLDRGNI